MASAFSKEVKRSITHSWGRFLAIALIAALGCGFFAGLRMTSVDMDLSADIFYDGTNLSDIYVSSSLGLDQENIDQLATIEGVEAVAGVKMIDSYATVGDTKYVVRINGIDLDDAQQSDTSDGQQALSDSPAYINRPILTEGSWPQKENECVIAADAVLDAPVAIGDRVSVVDDSEDDSLEVTSFIVTGFVRSPYYLMTSNFGSSSLGAGEIETYIYVSEEDFSEDYPFSGAFITVEGAREEAYPSAQYDELVDAVIERIEALSYAIRVQRLDAIKADAQSELDDGWATFASERDSALVQLDDAKRQLDDAQVQLNESERTLAEHRTSLNQAKEQIEEGTKQLEESSALLEEKQAYLESQKQELETQEQQLVQKEQAAQKEFSDKQALINMMPEGPARVQAQAELDAARAQAQAGFDAARKQIDTARTQLGQGELELAAGQQRLEEERQKLAQGQAAYEQGSGELSRGYDRYRAGLTDYDRGVAEYESNRVRALEELDDAEQELIDAQAEIDDLELPELYILDRSKNVGVAGHKADADRIDQIAQVFPLIFFLVAALVVLTTMTRMVDEERMLIGTYKALGYSNGRIISKYLIYAFVTSGIGSIIGILVLTQFLPQFIMNAYSIIYALPVSVSPLNVPIALLAFGLSVGITLLVTWLAARSSLRERPAFLMLPRAPKPGKRILLERVSFLWKRLSFSSKVTARNLFRYKQRFFMALIGIAGCTALLLTGLGLYDGINDIIDKQFGELQTFNLEVQTSDEQGDDDAQKTLGILESSPIVEELTEVAQENVLVATDGASEDLRASIIIPEDLTVFCDFFTLRERVSQEPLALSDDGVIVTEKLASELGVGVGQTIDIYDQSIIGEREGASHSARIAGICEFYTGQRIFMTPTYYERVMGCSSVSTDYLVKAQAPLEERTALADSLLDVSGVEVVSYYDEVIETYRTMLQTVNAVVWVLIISAALLAFVVIYNLTNINIAERTREIATLKVLGFTPRETNAYIIRETLILTILGALLGLLLGLWMAGFVVVTAEVNEMMFGRDIHFTSFVLAFVLTIVFSLIVSLAMMPKIKSIDMVQSLKSVE